MASDAFVTLTGTVVKEPKTSIYNNTTILTLSVAVQTTKKQKDSKYYESDLYQVTLWGKKGETLVGRIQVKTKVLVTGTLMLSEPWKDRNGKEHQSLSVTADNVKILSGGNWSAIPKTTEETAQEAVEEAVDEAEDGDSLPF